MSHREGIPLPSNDDLPKNMQVLVKINMTNTVT